MIQKKRIFNIEGYLSRYCETGIDFFIGVNLKDVPEELLKRAGLNAEVGRRVKPRPVGPISRYNTNGKIVKLKNQPKIKIIQRRHYKKTGAYMGTWHPWVWKKQYLPALEEEIEVVQLKDDFLFISKPLQYLHENENINCHIVNLFLEVFGCASFYTKNLERRVYHPAVRKGNWIIFPEGTKPEEKHESVMAIEKQRAVDQEKRGIKSYASNLEILQTYGPSDIVRGANEFNRYYAYIFSDRGIVVVESPDYGNATFVLPIENWEENVQKTKGDIVNENLHLKRVPHDENWANTILNLMRS